MSTRSDGSGSRLRVEFRKWGATQGWRSPHAVASSGAVRRYSLLLMATIAGLPIEAGAQTEPPPPVEPTPPIVEPPIAEPSAEPPIVEPPAAEPSAPEATVAVPPADIAVRGLSWDIMAGGIPSSGGLLQAELGFSALPRVAYHYTIDPNFSLGGLVALDYARWAPVTAFTTSLVVAAVGRYSVYRDDSWSIGLRGEPGVRIGFDDPFVFGILLNLQGHIGYTVEPRLIIGGGIDVPMELAVPDQGSAFFIAPLLFGGFAEFHVTPPLALTVDVKAGPHLNTAGNVFGMRILAGLAVRM